MSKSDLLLDAIGEIRDDMIADAQEGITGQEEKPGARRSIAVTGSKRWRLVPAAAVLCAVAVGAVILFGKRGVDKTGENKIQQWTMSFAAEDYFSYGIAGEDSVESSMEQEKSDMLAPYATSRFYSDERESLEQEGSIPVLDTHPLFDCVAHFYEDGSLYSVEMSWHRRGEIEEYSDLWIKAGYQEIEETECCVFIELDEKGNVVTPRVTVTERDGVQIVAEDYENREKTMTFQTEHGWYQVGGSWNDSYEDVVALYEWIWEHPLEFERFMSGGDEIEYVGDLEVYPESFTPYIPDFAALGYETCSTQVGFKNGEAFYFGGDYSSEEAGYLAWYIHAEPDYYEVQESLGSLNELTREQVLAVFAEDGSQGFFWDEYYVSIYLGAGADAEAAWQLIQAVQEK